MTAKKAAAKKATAKKSEAKADEVIDAKPISEAAAPEMEGAGYDVGYIGVSRDDEDHSVAAQIAKLSKE